MEFWSKIIKEIKKFWGSMSYDENPANEQEAIRDSGLPKEEQDILSSALKNVAVLAMGKNIDPDKNGYRRAKPIKVRPSQNVDKERSGRGIEENMELYH